MSHTQHSNTPASGTGISGNLVAAVLILNLLLVGFVLIGKTLPPRPEPAEGLSVAWVQTQASKPLPTATPLPTSIPTAAPVQRPFRPDAQRVRAGEQTFLSVCSACHGFSAQGVSGLGPSLIDNTFINGLSNDEFLAFVNVGRASDHPDNKSGITMPARGGNPSITDNDVVNVINYVRSLNPNAVVYATRPTDGTAGTADTAAQPGSDSTSAPVEAIEFRPIDLSALGAAAATATPVEAIEFKPIDLSALGGSSPTATPTATP